jgi:hypothetical protein
MKTAIIVNGICRQTLVASLSWHILPLNADWYFSTWDYTQETYFPEMIPSKKEIDKIRHLFKHIEINDFESYFTNFIGTGKVNPMFRSFKLLNSIRDRILAGGYERVVILRPDLYLHKLKGIDSSDFAVDKNTVKILGLHKPENFYSVSERKADDLFFVMPINVFEKYSSLEYVQKLNRQFKYRGDIHKLTFHFFDSLEINVIPITKMKSVLVRKEAENYYIQNKEIDFEKILDIFMQVYINKDLKGIGKFWHQFNKIGIQEPDLEKIKLSQENGGILKLRKT